MTDAKDLVVEVVGSVDDVTQRKWDGALNQADYTNIYQSYSWLKCMEGVEGFTPRHIVIWKHNTIIALFPGFIETIQNTPIRRYSSMRPGYGGSLILTHEKQCFDLYLKTVNQICGGTVFSHRVLTPEPRYARYCNIFKNRGYKLDVDNYNFTLDISQDWDTIFRNMQKRKRQTVKKMVKKSHLIETWPINHDEINSFYQLFQDVIVKVGGHLLPKSFFDNIPRYLKDQVILVGVKEDNHFVAAYLKVLDKKQKTIRGLFGGVPDLEKHRGYTELLYIGAINYGMENGYEVLDLGGAPASIDRGLFQFKISWNAVPSPIMYWEKAYNPFWGSMKQIYTMFRKPSVY